MTKSLNFNTIKKQYFNVTLPNEKKTTLMIGTPTKAIMNELVGLQSSIEAISEKETDLDAIDNLYNACAKVMSRNKAGVKITKEYLEEIFDFEDILIFFGSYINFVSDLSNRKN